MYCAKCGAYIPDEETKCLACGFDPKAEQAARVHTSYSYGASAAQTQPEYAQRTYEKPDYVKEFEKKREEEKRRAYEWAQSEQGKRITEQAKLGKTKALAVLSYFSVLCFLPYFLAPDDAFARFHARQGLILLICNVLVTVAAAITGIAGILKIFTVYCMIKGIINAAEGKTEELPVIGKFKL